MKFVKYISAVIGLVVLIVIGFAIYFAGQLSSTYPPIESYTLDFTKSEFEFVLKEIDKQDAYTIAFTDTTGLDLDSEYNYYFNVLNVVTSDNFLLKFKSNKNFIRGEKIKLYLIGLHNKSTNQIIYGPDEGAENVVEKFETELIRKIKN